MTIFSYIRNHAVLASSVALVAIVTAVVAGRAARRSDEAPTDAESKRVALTDVSAYLNGTSTVSADGIVEALSQADLKSQMGAPISSLRVEIGDSVYAGQVIMELENSDIRAQLAQVEGQYGSTKETSLDSMRDAYIKADAAVRAQIDQLILNNVDPRPQFYSYVIDQALANRIRAQRSDLDPMFLSWKATIDGLDADSSDQQIRAAVEMSQSVLDKITSLLNDMSQALSQSANVSVSSSLPAINAMQATITAARSSVSGAKQSLSTASVPVAQAGVRNLEAQLAKTIIRSPISGKVAALPLRTSEFAAPGQLLATIIGTGGMQVRAYVSGEDLPRISAGAAVVVQGNVSGTVSSLAPSISTANRKAEVIIRISDPAASGLVVGQNIQARINAAPSAGAGTTAGSYTLPIQDVKIIPGAAYVFTVDQESRAVRVPVTLGAVSGSFVEVIGGLEPGMKIVEPVYEIEEGQKVDTE